MSDQDPKEPEATEPEATEPEATEPEATGPDAIAPEETTWTGEAGPDADTEAAQVDPEAATDIASTAEDAPVAASAAPDAPVASAPRAPSRPARGRSGRRSGAGAADESRAPVVRAQAKYVRTSARKARLVCDHIRGKSVEEARAILAMTPRSVAEDWQKLLESAVANAEHNHELVGDELKVLAVYADEGPTLKRFRPRAMGRATPIRKRTSHLTIQLTPKER